MKVSVGIPCIERGRSARLQTTTIDNGSHKRPHACQIILIERKKERESYQSPCNICSLCGLPFTESVNHGLRGLLR